MADCKAASSAGGEGPGVLVLQGQCLSVVPGVLQGLPGLVRGLGQVGQQGGGDSLVHVCRAATSRPSWSTTLLRA